MIPEEYLTLAEASRYLRLSPGSIYRLIRQGELAAVKEGRCWKIRRADLEELAEDLGEREEIFNRGNFE